jgi:hypothetical protein
MRWAERIARTGKIRNAYKILVENPEGKIHLGGPMRITEDNIKMDLREVWFGGVDWIHLAQDRDR